MCIVCVHYDYDSSHLQSLELRPYFKLPTELGDMLKYYSLSPLFHYPFFLLLSGRKGSRVFPITITHYPSIPSPRSPAKYTFPLLRTFVRSTLGVLFRLCLSSRLAEPRPRRTGRPFAIAASVSSAVALGISPPATEGDSEHAE